MLMEDYKKLRRIVTELSLRGKRLNSAPVFISQSFFEIPKTKTKGNILFYHENTQQKKTPTNSNKSFD